mmetsp:Transcript_60728/g.131627  ORF Transcript_60728/g.131627 Transcript_60728/m.131627 type:complete len:206 (+) Transcript_60728:422-1039(+)
MRGQAICWEVPEACAAGDVAIAEALHRPRGRVAVSLLVGLTSLEIFVCPDAGRCRIPRPHPGGNRRHVGHVAHHGPVRVPKLSLLGSLLSPEDGFTCSPLRYHGIVELLPSLPEGDGHRTFRHHVPFEPLLLCHVALQSWSIERLRGQKEPHMGVELHLHRIAVDVVRVKPERVLQLHSNEVQGPEGEDLNEGEDRCPPWLHNPL